MKITSLFCLIEKKCNRRSNFPVFKGRKSAVSSCFFEELKMSLLNLSKRFSSKVPSAQRLLPESRENRSAFSTKKKKIIQEKNKNMSNIIL